MKAPNFRYVRARSLKHAYEVLRHHGDNAVPLAGGQSLLAGLNMRVSSPEVLVDIGDLSDLKGISVGKDGIQLGALTRHVDVLSSELLRKNLPLLPEAVSHVGHAAIRNRGTVGGSLAYADPAAELPACAVALDATIIVGGPQGERRMKADDFFTGLMETDLHPGELILAVHFPVPAGSLRHAFLEYARRQGDFAVAGLAATMQVEGGRIASPRFVYFGCVERAQVAAGICAALSGQPVPIRDRAPLIDALDGDLSPDDTPGWRTDTKRQLARVLTERALDNLAQPRTSQ
jgi:carbon-monoxide dehydrogenase medium subunit